MWNRSKTSRDKVHMTLNSIILLMHMFVLMSLVNMMLRSNKKKQDDGGCTSKDEKFAVESILDERKRNGQVEYLVKWVGYPHSDSTWEPPTNVNSESYFSWCHHIT